MPFAHPSPSRDLNLLCNPLRMKSKAGAAFQKETAQCNTETMKRIARRQSFKMAENHDRPLASLWGHMGVCRHLMGREKFYPNARPNDRVGTDARNYCCGITRCPASRIQWCRGIRGASGAIGLDLLSTTTLVCSLVLSANIYEEHFLVSACAHRNLRRSKLGKTGGCGDACVEF